jgi:hypothetical protein
MLTILEKCTKCWAVRGPAGERRTGRVRAPPHGLADFSGLGPDTLNASKSHARQQDSTRKEAGAIIDDLRYSCWHGY